MSPDWSSASLSERPSPMGSKRTDVSNSTSSKTASSWWSGSPLQARSTGNKSASVCVMRAQCVPAKERVSVSGS
eukprot:5210056-Prymnesium_polylepis.1